MWLCERKEERGERRENVGGVVEGENGILESGLVGILENRVNLLIVVLNRFEERGVIMLEVDRVKVRCWIRGLKVREEGIGGVWGVVGGGR